MDSGNNTAFMFHFLVQTLTASGSLGNPVTLYNSWYLMYDERKRLDWFSLFSFWTDVSNCGVSAYIICFLFSLFQQAVSYMLLFRFSLLSFAAVYHIRFYQQVPPFCSVCRPCHT